MNGYDLSRNFWEWCFNNPEKVKPIHSAIFFFAIEHCNRLGWKDKFGFPSQMVMEAIGVKNWRTYSAGLKDLVDFGFIEMLETSKNQYSSNIIAIVNFTNAPTNALDKALQKHGTKHGQSTYRGTVSIDKQETINKEQVTYSVSDFLKDWNEIRKEITGKPSFLNIIGSAEQTNQFQILSKAYGREHFRNAIKGLFKQDKFPKGVTAMNSSPKHFLGHFELYLTAYGDKNKNVWGNED